MEISTSQRKIEVVFTKAPFLLKAGIPFFLPIVAFLSSKILSSRRISSSAAISPPSAPPSEEKERQNTEEPTPDSTDLISKSSGLDNSHEEAVEDLYKRGIELELHFILYQAQKERESKVLEINHKLCMEKIRLDFFTREMGLMQDERLRMGEMVTGILKLMKEIEGLRWTRRLAQRRVKKLGTRLKEKSKTMREQRMVMKTRHEEIGRNKLELNGKDRLIQELRNEIGQLRFAVEQLEQDKIELSNNINESDSTKPHEIGNEFVSKEDNDYVVKELLRVEDELNTLRWDNACLRHDIISLKQENKDDQNHSVDVKGITNSEDGRSISSEVIHLDWQLQRHSNNINNNNGSSSGSDINTPEHHESRRKRLFKKLRVWGKSSDHHHHKEKQDKLDSTPGYNAVDQYVPRRNSFSS